MPSFLREEAKFKHVIFKHTWHSEHEMRLTALLAEYVAPILFRWDIKFSSRPWYADEDRAIDEADSCFFQPVHVYLQQADGRRDTEQSGD